MDSSPLDRHAENPMEAWDKVQRMSEPWALSRAVVLVGGLLFAMVLSNLAATGQFEWLILVAVWVIACLVIVFVRDYWWAPALVVTALSLETNAAGFKLTGLEVGMVILGLTFPVKLAMKTLWPAKPKLEAGLIYWALLAFVAAHAVVILFYSKMESVPQIKNVIKAYYGALAPLVLYGMLINYCNPRTVVRTCVVLFAIWSITILIAIPVSLLGIDVNQLTDLKIELNFLTTDGAVGLLRYSAPLLFIGAIAFWPAARSTAARFVLGCGLVLAVVGVLVSSGRTSTGSCFFAAAFFAVARRRLWLALPGILAVVGIAAICTVKPEVLYALPEQVQRALEPLNFSEDKTEIQGTVESSDQWHQELRTDSLTYWNMDTTSFWVGHGFKSWDDTINLTDNVNIDYEKIKQYAIEMGLTENMFSDITNIFGLTGLLLYGGFLIQLAWRLWKARGLCPEKSPERAVCEFSFVNLVTAVALAPVSGVVPNITLIYWALGLLAARPFIGIVEQEKAAPAAAFDLSRKVVRVSGGGGASRVDPLTAFAKRQARLEGTGAVRPRR